MIFKLLWLPVFWFIAAIVTYELDQGGIFLVGALAAATAVSLWTTSGDDKGTDK